MPPASSTSVSIKVFEYNSGKEINDIEDVQVAFLAVGEADQYLQDTPVPAHFTVGKLKDLVAKVGAKPRTVSDTVEEALSAAIKDLDTTKDHSEGREVFHSGGRRTDRCGEHPGVRPQRTRRSVE